MAGNVNSEDESVETEASPLLQSTTVPGETLKRIWTSGETGRFHFRGIRNVLLAILCVAFGVIVTITLPIMSGTFNQIGSDPFVQLLHGSLIMSIIYTTMTVISKYTVDRSLVFSPRSSCKILLLIGLLSSMNWIFSTFASPPSRTPGYLQGLLSTTRIPVTIICRWMFLRKGVSAVRVICAFIVVVGLFITLEPQIWGLNRTDDSNTASESLSTRILWPLCFALGSLPEGIMNVIFEKELKRKEVYTLSFTTWTQFSITLVMMLLFWVDFIPGFGMSSSVTDFWHRVKRGFTCCYSTDSSCRNLVIKAWIFYGSYSLGGIVQYWLIKYAEGAVYAVVVEALVGPTAAIFWSLFEFDASTDIFRWHPVFNTSTYFTICGLGLMVPGVVLYNYFSNKESKEVLEQENF